MRTKYSKLKNEPLRSNSNVFVPRKLVSNSAAKKSELILPNQPRSNSKARSSGRNKNKPPTTSKKVVASRTPRKQRNSSNKKAIPKKVSKSPVPSKLLGRKKTRREESEESESVQSEVDDEKSESESESILALATPPKRGRPTASKKPTSSKVKRKTRVRAVSVSVSEVESEESESISEPEPKLSKPSKQTKSANKKQSKKLSSEISLQTLSQDIYLSSKDNNLITDCCIHCNNRNVIRAVWTSNQTLFRKCIDSTKEISSLNDYWSAESDLNPFQIAIKNGDKKMLVELISYYTDKKKLKKNKERVRKPMPKLRKTGSGRTSMRTFGFRVSKVQMTRGGRLGNNAFLDDTKKSLEWKKCLVNALFRYPKQTVKLLPFLKTVRFSQNYLNFNQIRFKPETVLNLEMNIYNSVNRGNRQLAAYFLEKMKHVETFGFNELHKKALKAEPGDKMEIKFKPSVNKKSRLSVTPVHFACINPNEKVLKALLDNTGDINFNDYFNKKPIHYAAVCEGDGPLKLLIGKGANVNEREKNRFTPLLYAAKNGRLENVKLLIKHGAEVNHKPSAGANAALHWAALEGHLEVVDYLLSLSEVDINSTGADRMTPLHLACKVGNEDLVELLLEKGADVNSKDKLKRTPFLMAVKSGFPRIAALLLNHDANFEQADNSGNTPLHYACAYGWMENVKILLKIGADINAVNSWKTTPLEIAILKNHFGIVKYMLNSSNIDVNTKFDKGNTLLMHSFLNISSNTVDEIIFLIKDKKCDVSLSNMNKSTPLHFLAKFTLDRYIRNFVPSFGKDAKSERKKKKFIYQNKDKLVTDHQTLLRTLIKLLVDNGADIDAKDMNGLTPFIVAFNKSGGVQSDVKSGSAIRWNKRRVNYNYNNSQTYSEVSYNPNYPFMIELLQYKPDLLSVTKSGNNILHLLAHNIFGDDASNLWKLLLKELSDAKYSELLRESNFLNTVNNQGLTPLLRFSYTYYKDVYNFYNKILKQAIFDFQISRKKKTKKTTKRKPSRRPAMPGIKSIRRVPWNPQTRDNNNIKKTVDLTKEEKEKLKIETNFKFIDWLNLNIVSIFKTLVNLGCDPVITTSKESKEEISKKNKISHNSRHMHNYRYVNKRNNKKDKKSLSKEEEENKIEKLTQDYYNGYGNANCLMFFLTFPIVDLVKYIVEEVKDNKVNHTDVLGQNYLFYLLKNRESIIKIAPELFNNIFDYFVVEKKIDVNCTDVVGNSLFLLHAKDWLTEEMIKLYNAGSDVNAENESGENTLLHYVQNNDSKKVDWLLQNFPNMDINHQNKYQCTPLHYVMFNDNVSSDINYLMMSTILNKVTDPNIQDYLGRTPMFYLFIKDDEYVKTAIDPIASLSFLLEIKNIKLNVRDIYGNTVLFYAIQRSASICISSLIARGAEVNVKNIEGNSPLANTVLMDSNNSTEIITNGGSIHDKIFPLKKRNITLEKLKKKAEGMIVEEKSEESIILDDEDSEDSENESEDENPVDDERDEEEEEDIEEDNYEDEVDVDEMTDDENEEEPESEAEADAEAEAESEEESEVVDAEEINTDCLISFTTRVNNVLLEFMNLEGNENLPSMNNYLNNSNSIFGITNNDKNKDEDNEEENPEDSDINAEINEDISEITEKEEKEKNEEMKKRRKEGISLFHSCVILGKQGLIYYILNQNYDLSTALHEVFSESKFNMALLLLNKSRYNETYQKTNEKDQNLFHSFFRNAVSLPSDDAKVLFEKLYSKGIPLNTYDKEGYLPIHYACKNLSVTLTKLILSKLPLKEALSAPVRKEGFDHTPLALCFSGYNVPSTKRVYKLVKYLLNEIKSTPDSQSLISQLSAYFRDQDVKGKEYYTTPLNKVTQVLAKYALDNNGRKGNDNVSDVEEEDNLDDDENEDDNEGLVKNRANMTKTMMLDYSSSSSELSDKDKLCDIYLIELLVDNGANVMEKDSNGNDCLMHTAIQNRPDLLFDFFLMDERFKKQVQYDSVNKEGKSLIHLIVQPFEMGSYQNTDFLSKAIKAGFKCNIVDNFGKRPIDYAYQQQIKDLYNILSMHDKTFFCMIEEISEAEDAHMMDSTFNFEDDADKYYNMKKEEVKDDEKFEVLIDPVARLNSKSFALYKEGDLYYDVTLTKVDIGRYKYGEFLFYKMQVIQDLNRDIYILWNRWGRIGEEGAYQRTPFTTAEEACKEFRKIFKAKTGNNWEEVNDFQKKPKKYMLIKHEENRKTHKDFLEKFRLDDNTPKSELPEEIKHLVQNFTRKAIIFKVFKNYNINKSLFSLSMLNKELINKARSLLEEIGIAQFKIEELREKASKIEKSVKEIEDEKSKLNEINENILKCFNTIYQNSNRYYELIPKEEDTYRRGMSMRILRHKNNLNEENTMILELTYVETAVKILLGALYRQHELNPLDYCYRVLNTGIWKLDESSLERNYLMQYINNTKANFNFKVTNIFGVDRKADDLGTNKNLNNHFLLFHGTKVYNLVGILSAGLKIAPIDAPPTGASYGNGIYFADMIAKSYNYCESMDYYNSRYGNEKKDKRKYVLLCQVALGKMLEVGWEREFKDVKQVQKGGFNSVKALGMGGPALSKNFVLNNGLIIPQGKSITYAYDEKLLKKGRKSWNCHLAQHAEYIVYNENQVKIKYIVEIEDKK